MSAALEAGEDAMRWKVIAAAGLAVLLHAGVPDAGVRAAEISLSCSSLGKEYEICKQGAEAWAKKTGNNVKLVSTPNSATERLALYQQLLAAGAGDVDVFQIDVVWPGILGQHFLDLAKKAAGQIDQHFPVMVQGSTVGGRLVGMPWFADAG